MTLTSVDERTLTLDDFLQLEALLNYEQEERDKHIAQCQLYCPQVDNNNNTQQDKVVAQRPHHHSPVHTLHQHRHRSPIQFRRAIDQQAALQSQLEKVRLAEALMKLKWLKDQYRRQRMMDIELYLANYRRQALIRAVLQEEEERYYRQCIAAALEQRRVQLCLQQYLDMKRQQELQSQFETRQFLADQQQRQQEKEEEGEEYRRGYSEYHKKQLEALLKHIFNQQIQQEDEVAWKKQAKSEEEQALAMAEIWKFLSDQKLNNETPRSAFLPEDHDVLLKKDGPKEKVADSVPPPAYEEEQEKVKDSEFKKEQEEVKQQKSFDVKEEKQEIQFPPVQEHVVSLQELIHQLASEPVLVDEQNIQYSDEPKPSGIWAKQEQQQQQQQKSPPHHNKSKHNNQPIPPPVSTAATTEKNKEEKEEEVNKKPFLPQRIFTEAEPTPTLENMPNTPLGAQEQEEKENQDFKHFVDSVAAEQKNETIPEDPRNLKAYDDLDAIAKRLMNPSSDVVKRWQHVMQSGEKLTFSKQQEGTLLVTASTDLNRAFLGSEDELMRIMLKLDTIDSLGDVEIREERKKLVKKCESMLDDLDRFKQAQWETAVTQ